MNTERSEQFVKTWLSHDNALQRSSLTCEKSFKASPEILFPLLCPTTEYDWIPGWECELLHSRSGYAEYNAVFRTRFFGLEEIWVCTRFEPHKAIDYTRFSKDMTAVVAISLTDNYDGTVSGRWVITASALNEGGNAAVERLMEGGSDMEELLATLDHYVTNGQMAS